MNEKREPRVADRREHSEPTTSPDSSVGKSLMRRDPEAVAVDEGEPRDNPARQRDILRALFRQPKFNQCDGLDDYDRDFQGFQLPPEAVRTARQNLADRARTEANQTGSDPLRQPTPGPADDAGPRAGIPESQPLRRNPASYGRGPSEDRQQRPRFAELDVNRCAYDRKGREGCRRCLSICPNRAIIAEDGRLQIDPDRCRGGGICATACPAGAITYRHPTPQDLLVMLRLQIDAAVEAGVRSPVIVFQDGNTPESLRTHFEALGTGMIPVEVHDIGAVGMEIWLNALVYGAGCVVATVGPATPAATIQELSAQRTVAELLVKGLGYEGTRIEVVDPIRHPPPQRFPERLLPGEAGGTGSHPFTDKRNLIHQALEILHRHSPHPRTAVDLPVGAPFGTVILNRDTCTLCSACVDICPTDALRTGGGRPQLRFTEAACVQCGLCRRLCPERALGLFPRYVYDRIHSDTARILHQEEPLRCIRCGRPFGVPGVIRKLETQLAGHWMYADEPSRRQLQMCHACRLAELFSDGSGKPMK